MVQERDQRAAIKAATTKARERAWREAMACPGIVSTAVAG